MRRWIMAWLSGWYRQRFVVSSPLSVDDARRRLTDGLTGRRAAFAMGLSPFTGRRIVRGRVRQDTVRLVAMRPGVRNSWRPVLRGRLRVTSTGCQLACDLGWHPFVRVFSAFWLGAVLLALVAGVVTAAGHLVTGQFAAARNSAALAGVASGFVLFFVGLTTFAGWLGREDVAYLRTWLAERLDSRD